MANKKQSANKRTKVEMTEEKFLEGFIAYRDSRIGGLTPEWASFVTDDIVYFSAVTKPNLTTEEARMLWRRENSPLVKALK